MLSFTVLCILFIVPSYVYADFYHPQCTSSGFTCLDCYTQKLCIGSTLWSNVSCNDGMTGNKNIYCNPGTNQCTSVPPLGCDSKKTFQCPQSFGYFPDVNDCHRYYVCKDNIPQLVSCPSKYIYNQRLGKCVFQLQDSDCFKISCPSFINSVYVHPQDPSLYYQCLTGVPNLFSCPENYIYDLALKKCQNICNKVGKVANSKNCSEFTTCEAVGTSFIPIKTNCRNGYGFNPIDNECQKNLDRLCVEISNFNNSLMVSPQIPNFIKDTIKGISSLLGRLDLSFILSFIYTFIPVDIVTTVLLSGDYIITHNFRIPPLLLNYIIEIVVNLLPENSRNTLKFAVSLIFGNSPF